MRAARPRFCPRASWPSSGRSRAGDAVVLKDRSGAVIARGLTEFSSADLDRVKGHEDLGDRRGAARHRGQGGRPPGPARHSVARTASIGDREEGASCPRSASSPSRPARPRSASPSPRPTSATARCSPWPHALARHAGRDPRGERAGHGRRPREGRAGGLLDRLELDAGAPQGDLRGAQGALAAARPASARSSTGHTLPNGIELTQVRVPLGVVAMIYEARPNVTADAAGLCIKTGNAVILRGGSLAVNSNLDADARAGRGRRGAGTARRLHPGDRVDRPRRRRGADEPARPHRRAHPARRRRADQERRRERQGPGHRDRHRQLPHLHPRVGRPRDGRSASSSTPSASARRVQRRRVAAGRRGGLRAASCPPILKELEANGVDARRRREDPRASARSCGIEPATEEDWGTEYHDLKMSREGRHRARRGDHAHQHVRHQALRGDRHRGLRGRAALPARGRRGGGLRERVDALHRRRGVRPRRRDRHLDPEAARARPDGPRRRSRRRSICSWGAGRSGSEDRRASRHHGRDVRPHPLRSPRDRRGGARPVQPGPGRLHAHRAARRQVRRARHLGRAPLPHDGDRHRVEPRLRRQPHGGRPARARRTPSTR